MEIKNKRIGGVSADAILLTFIKLVTTALGLATTRLLSEYLSVHDYGTYSQVLLIVSTIGAVTIFGMMDGMNYFYCKEDDKEKREAYTATIFVSQFILGTVVGCVVMLLSAPLCVYFDNPDLKGLLIFAAALPTLQNLLWVLQVLIVSVGEARKLALRNFIVSVVRLTAVICVVTVIQSVAFFMTVTLVLDALQIAYFIFILHKSDCHIRISKTNFRLLGEILKYCAPMAIFIIVNSLNRDMDKFLISMVTDTETLAMYTNASKQLPFDILMSSFNTVLVPYLTKLIADHAKEEAAKLYKLFLEITYISTGILCCAAISAAPQLMKLLYSNKYTYGLIIFCIYIFVDLFRFTNVSMVLATSGKTKLLMMLGMGSLVVNVVLNAVFYKIFGLVGPAVATLTVTILVGIIMLCCNAKVLDTRLSKLFDLKYLALFTVESVILTVALSFLRNYLDLIDVHYFVLLIIIGVLYVLTMLLLNGKRILNDMKNVNRLSGK